MDVKNTEVETTEVQPASTEQPTAVEKIEEQSPAAEIDYATEYAALLEENVRISSDRNNYRKGLLHAKGKKQVDEEELSEDEKIEQLLDRKLAERDDKNKEDKKRELAMKLVKENRELKIALQNRSQVSVGASGSSTKETVTNDTYWSKDQLEYFKKRGLDPNTVKKNIEHKEV